MDPLVLFLVFLPVVGVIAYVSWRMDQKRRERIMAYALSRAWLFVHEDPSLVDAWPGEPFGRGDNRRARTVLRGKESGRDFVAFDYSYQTHHQSNNRRTTTTHRFAVAAVALPAPIGIVEIRPESMFSRAADAVGLSRDIELESEDFNRRFRVEARDPKLASDVLPPRTMEYLVGQEPGVVPAMRFTATHVVTWRTGALDPAEVVVTCAVVDRVLDGIPSFVWRDAGLPGGYDPGP